MSAKEFDVIIIGGGPGGYVTAIRAAQLGFSTALIENKHLGGICLNWGCIPTKALLRSAEVYHLMKHAADFGLSCTQPTVDFAAVIKRSRQVSAQLNKGVGFLLKKNKVTVLEGRGRLKSKGVVVVEGKDAGEYKAAHTILATGARPRSLPGIEPDGSRIWTYFDALAPEKLPAKILIMGSGAIGMEFASFYATMGSEVTVVEVLDQVLPVEDSEIAAQVSKSFKANGITILTQTKVTRVEKTSQGIKATLSDAKGQTQSLDADVLISAVGVVGNSEDLGLESLGVKTDKGCIVTDGYGRTNIEGIYAIGDVAGPPMLAHKAEHEGVICIETIKGLPTHPMKKEAIPGCTYCHPQVASVGLTEARAKAEGYEVRVGRFPLIGNGKAVALGDTDGMVKTVFDNKTGALLGAHMVGPEVTEMIQGFVIAMGLETTEEDLIHTIFPHPTVSESMHESVLAAFDRVVHV